MSRGDRRMSAVPSPTITALLALRARDVLAGLGVDPDHVPLADEVRHLHHQAGLGGGALQDVGDGRALEPRGGLDDLQVDRLRQAHAHRFPLVELDLDARVGDQELDRVAEDVRLERHLLEVLRVHEVVLVVALVEELQLVLLERHALGLVLGAEAVLGLRPAAQVAQLGLHHAAPVAGRHVHDVHHAPEVVLVLDDHAHAELRGGDQHRDGSSQGAARRTFPSSIGARVAPTPAPAEDEPEGGWGCPRALSPCPSGQTSHRRPLDVNGRAWPDTPAERAFLAGGGAVEGSHRARRLLWQPRMNAGVPIGPRALLPALVTRALAHGVLHSAASFLLSPLSALAPEDEVWVSCAADFDAHAPHPTPVVLVHGFLGTPGHFRFLRRFLVVRGFHNFATFAYAPRVDQHELAHRLGRAIEAVCEATGRAEVDVVGHSLGGLVARHLLERGEGAGVRRLVTLGAPYLTDALPERESAIFGAADVIIPPPPHRLQGRSATVMGCGHLGLLYHPAVLRQVAACLGEPAEEPRKAARALRAA